MTLLMPTDRGALIDRAAEVLIELGVSAVRSNAAGLGVPLAETGTIQSVARSFFCHVVIVQKVCGLQALIPYMVFVYLVSL